MIDAICMCNKTKINNLLIWIGLFYTPVDADLASVPFLPGSGGASVVAAAIYMSESDFVGYEWLWTGFTHTYTYIAM